MKTVFYNDYTTDRALFNPTDYLKPMEHFPEGCISTFSKEIIDKFATFDQVKQITCLHTANGEIPIYQIKYGGKEFAFYLSPVGAPASAACLEEVIALGAKKFVFFGSCGVLDDAFVGRKLIVPTAAVRDEGTSYHYVAPGEEIIPPAAATKTLTECLNRCGYPYVQGKVWTTDAIYRETVNAINERKKAGCIAVEMEYSALLSVARFRKVSFVQFLYGADCLDHEEWDFRDLADHGLASVEKYLALALECGLAL